MSSRPDGAVTESEGLTILPIPHGLQAIGTRDAPFEAVASVRDLPPGALSRVTRGDLDVLLVHTAVGLAAIDDRCPHMSAPLSLGELDGCVIACPLHSGRFDIATGGVVQFPTTGGLDADGAYHPTWSPPDREPRPEPTDLKARARAATRIRRLRYYPLRIRDGVVELAWPA
ncbi:MAG TPA: Rieske 2Fe-2S domain-containing protein [Candidatus Sulfotelmatobacter sp.]|nr:Rieske 2Fe-2S domain-containing protein [Candidatus Sulfotelmatobacter sp.]